MRIAIDVMGGDHGPSVVVPGALDAARSLGVGVTLVGRQADIAQVLADQKTDGIDCSIVDAPDVIAMTEHAATAARRKPRSSLVVALREVKDGRAQAMVTAGHSGAAMAAGLMVLGRIPGIERPALATAFPSMRGKVLMLDLGAVTDPRPAHMVDFALMGSIYAREVMGVSDPLVGLLSNGEEESKGNQLVTEVHPLLRATPGIRFHGNIEGNDITRGVVDVVVTDGFTGNVTLKLAEGIIQFMTGVLREEVTSTLPRKLGALMLRPAFVALRNRFDYREYGGAPLLGLRAPAIVAHGRSDERAIESAVRVAAQFAAGNAIAAFAEVPRMRQAAVAASPETAPQS